MGLLLWLVAGSAGYLIARIIPSRRPQRPWAELIVTVVAAVAFGLAATYLDFGGWREPDWRAGLFAFFGAMIALGVKRLLVR